MWKPGGDNWYRPTFVSVTGEGGTSGVPVSYPGDLCMQHRAPRPIIDLLRRIPRATARPLGMVARLSPGRALVALVAMLTLGAGAYVAAASSLDDSANPPTASADRQPPGAVSRDGERPTLVAAPTPGGEAPERGTPEPGTSGPEPTGPQPPEADLAASTPSVDVTPDPARLSQPTESPRTASITPSESPSDNGDNGSSPSPDGSSPTPEDRIPPDTSLVEELLDGDEALFSFSATEPASFSCSLDGSAYVSCDSHSTYDDLDPGWHTLAVRATDRAGNVDPSPAEHRWHSSAGAGALDDD